MEQDGLKPKDLIPYIGSKSQGFGSVERATTLEPDDDPQARHGFEPAR